MTKKHTGLFRWAGGKGRIVEKLLAHITPTVTQRTPRWIEPFVGGGAVALEAMRRNLAREYVLADANADVMAVYRALATGPDVLLQELRDFAAQSEEGQRDGFAEQKPSVYDPQFVMQCAHRLLILQACSFNGLYRVNKSGVYNVPFGRCASFDFDLFWEAATLMHAQPVRLLTQDFEQTIALANPGDIVYADPPYLGTHSAYTAQGFTVEAHQRLAAALRRARDRDVVCWVSGSDCEETRTIYGGIAHTIEVPRSMSCKGATRGTKTELLIHV